MDGRIICSGDGIDDGDSEPCRGITVAGQCLVCEENAGCDLFVDNDYGCFFNEVECQLGGNGDCSTEPQPSLAPVTDAPTDGGQNPFQALSGAFGAAILAIITTYL